MKSLAVGFASLLMLGSGLAHAQVADDTQQPVEQPPPPPQQVPAPPPPQTAQPAPSASGQWVRTEQYGWVWMPYGQQYTYEPSDESAYPYEYVYRPSYGWAWLEAPWVWGWGAAPYWGIYGPARFAWYHGWRYPGYGYRGYRNGYHWGAGHGYAYRPGYGYRPCRGLRPTATGQRYRGPLRAP